MFDETKAAKSKELDVEQCDALWRGIAKASDLQDTPQARQAFFEGLRVGAMTIAAAAKMGKDVDAFFAITMDTIKQELP